MPKKSRNLLINPHDIIGRAGGIARASSLSKQRRREIALKAATARWGNKNDKDKTRKA